MSVKDNNIKNEKNQYHHLTKDDRIKIEFMLSQKDDNGNRLYSNAKIANELGVHKLDLGQVFRHIFCHTFQISVFKFIPIPPSKQGPSNLS